MRVTIRRRTTLTDGVDVDQENELHAEGSYAPDVAADLIARSFELWGWVLDYGDEDEP